MPDTIKRGEEIRSPFWIRGARHRSGIAEAEKAQRLYMALATRAEVRRVLTFGDCLGGVRALETSQHRKHRKK